MLRRARQELCLSNLTLQHPRPCLFVTSQCRHTTLYGWWRVLWAVYHVTWVLVSWVVEPWSSLPSGQRAKWFIYLTNWTFLLLTVHAVMEAATWLWVRALRPDIVQEQGPVLMPWYLRVQWCLYNVVTTGSIMVSAWYWAVIYKGDRDVGAVSLAFHAGNSLYVLLNLCVSATPTRLLHALHPALFGVAYTLFSALYELGGGLNIQGEAYVYREMRWSRPWRTLFVSSLSNLLAIPLTHLLLFLLGLAVTRVWTCCFREGGGGGGRGRGRGAVTCVDLGERGAENSSVQAEPLVGCE